jgi:hypothetical protein
VRSRDAKSDGMLSSTDGVSSKNQSFPDLSEVLYKDSARASKPGFTLRWSPNGVLCLRESHLSASGQSSKSRNTPDQKGTTCEACSTSFDVLCNTGLVHSLDAELRGMLS